MSETMRATTISQTSIYLTPEDRQVVADLMERTGMSRSEVFRTAVRRMAVDDETRYAELRRIADELLRLT